mgnify:CR=1 FL=1
MYEAVIFDMDGLMFDTEPIWASCWPKTAIEFGVECMEGLCGRMRGTNGAEAGIHYSRIGMVTKSDPQGIC